MKFDVMLTGVGGAGVLTTQVMIARAANIDGHFVRGVQFHGLAQRGGIIPTFIRFGSKDEVFSPGTLQANADLVLAFEPLEALRATYYARKAKTAFVINEYHVVPIYADLINVPYPTISEIISRLEPFAREIHLFDASHLGNDRFGSTVFGNTILLGVSVGLGILPITKEAFREAITATAPREIERNIQAFELGIQSCRNS